MTDTAYIKELFSDHRLDPELYNPRSKKCCFGITTLFTKEEFTVPVRIRAIKLLRNGKLTWHEIWDLANCGASRNTLRRWNRDNGHPQI